MTTRLEAIRKRLAKALIAAAPDDLRWLLARVERLEAALRGMDGFVTLILARDDLPEILRSAIIASHRVVECRAALADAAGGSDDKS